MFQSGQNCPPSARTSFSTHACKALRPAVLRPCLQPKNFPSVGGGLVEAALAPQFNEMDSSPNPCGGEIHGLIPLDGAAPSAPVARRVHPNGRARWFSDRPPASTERRPLSEPKLRGGICSLLFGGRRRDRGSRRGLGEATSNGHPEGSLLEGAAPSAPVARRVHPNGRARWFLDRPPASTERRPPPQIASPLAPRGRRTRLQRRRSGRLARLARRLSFGSPSSTPPP